MAKELAVGGRVGQDSASAGERGGSGGADATGGRGRGRWSVGKKRAVVLRLLRGESLEVLSREVRVSAARLTRWRDDFIEAGSAGLVARPTTPAELQLRKAQAKIGELMMRLELHEKKLMMRAARKRSDS